jgi:hypothetical protein
MPNINPELAMGAVTAAVIPFVIGYFSPTIRRAVLWATVVALVPYVILSVPQLVLLLTRGALPGAGQNLALVSGAVLILLLVWCWTFAWVGFALGWRRRSP